MTDERRYGDEEVATIFERAANHPAPGGSAVASTTASTGLTLRELQAIGAEVGLEPERIADAAASLEVHRVAAVSPRRSYLGAPVSVSRVVDLPRAPTDREWEQLVVELRQTFHAQGKQSSQGNLRSWTNGNLHALVEPTDTGYHLRMGTTKGDAITAGRMGSAMIVVALLMGLFFLMIGELDGDASPALLIAMVGVAALVFNAIRLPSWAREREEQMDHIAARAVTLIRAEPAPGAIGGGS
jgi:hypothetical protein